MIRPLRDLVVIEPESIPGKIGLLHIPDTGSARDKTGIWCKVVAAGPTVRDAHVGRRVHVNAYGVHPAADEVLMDGKTVYMTRERDLNGIEVS